MATKEIATSQRLELIDTAGLQPQQEAQLVMANPLDEPLKWVDVEYSGVSFLVGSYRASAVQQAASGREKGLSSEGRESASETRVIL